MKRCNSSGKTAIIMVCLIALLCWPVSCLIAETGEDELAYFYPETADRYKPDADGIWRVPFDIVLEREVIRQSHIKPYGLTVNGKSYHDLDTVPGGTRLQFRVQKIPAGLAMWKCWFAGNN